LKCEEPQLFLEDFGAGLVVVEPKWLVVHLDCELSSIAISYEKIVSF
jgi:hypothetical protein